jgi:hypothetical protein
LEATLAMKEQALSKTNPLNGKFKRVWLLFDDDQV